MFEGSALVADAQSAISGGGAITCADSEKTIVATSNIRVIYYTWFWFRLLETFTYNAFFDAYLSLVSGGGASFVGIIETGKSTTSFLLALPLGVLADWHRRSVVMKCSAIVACISCGCYLFAVLRESKPGIAVAACVYVMFERSYGGTMDAMVADSTTN